MRIQETTLNLLPIGSTAVITHIDDRNKSKYRMLDLGFTNDTSVSPVRKSPAGDPTAYLVKNTVIALRTEDARSIRVITYI